MGGNTSKTVTSVSVQTAIKATLNVTSSRSATSTNNQSLSFSGNDGTSANNIKMDQKVSISIKTSSKTNATTDFAAVIENDLKDKIKQAAEMGGLATNRVETLQTTAHSFAVDCSKVFSDNVSLFVSTDQHLKIDNNKKSSFTNVTMAQSVEGAIDAFTEIITKDKSVQMTKSILDKELAQTSQGFGGMFKAMVGPMIVLLLLTIVAGYIYFRARGQISR